MEKSSKKEKAKKTFGRVPLPKQRSKPLSSKKGKRGYVRRSKRDTVLEELEKEKTAPGAPDEAVLHLTNPVFFYRIGARLALRFYIYGRVESTLKSQNC